MLNELGEDAQAVASCDLALKGDEKEGVRGACNTTFMSLRAQAYLLDGEKDRSVMLARLNPLLRERLFCILSKLSS